MSNFKFLDIALDLDDAGLIWHPEIGDEVTSREELGNVSVLVDPQGMTPQELRMVFLWLPNVEQMVRQFEARQTILSHVGLELSERSICYKTVIRTPVGEIQTVADSLRVSVGQALRDLLVNAKETQIH